MKISHNDAERKGSLYGDTSWLTTATTLCSKDPEKFDRLGSEENMNVRTNQRVQLAISICRNGTNETPGQCPLLEQCHETGERVRDFAPGVYGGEYMGRTRDAWPAKYKD